MAEEQKDDRTSTEELEEIASSPPAPDEYPEGQAEELIENAPVEPNGVEKAVAAAHDDTEKLAEAATVQAFGGAVDAVQNAIESIPPAPEHPEEALAHDHHGDTIAIFGLELPYPLYTVIFFALGALTIIEVLFAEIFYSVEAIKIPVLLGIAFAKASLVVIFYMHLNTDSRIFALTLAVPLGIALLSTLFLLSIPAGSY
jgi:caa(3)-type oxidase subunit IV